MDEDVSAGSGITTVAGRRAPGITLLAFGLGNTAVIDGVSASDAASIAPYERSCSCCCSPWRRCPSRRRPRLRRTGRRHFDALPAGV